MNRNTKYAAFDETMLDTFGLTRLSYIGKEKEPENNLGDHGVRKYDYETGRFNSIDPLFEKYYGWSPYQYSMNNPIWAKDWNGQDVWAANNDSKETIRALVPGDLHQYIIFDNNGCIDRALINSVSSQSSNFQSLQFLVNHELDFEVNVTDKFSYQDAGGNMKSIDFGTIRVDDTWESGAYTLSTKELGWLGHTLLPGKGDTFNSTNNNVQVNINSNLSKRGRNEILSHELLGHAFFYGLGFNPNHIFNEGGYEGNLPLKNQIINSMQETRTNTGE